MYNVVIEFDEAPVMSYFDGIRLCIQFKCCTSVHMNSTSKGNVKYVASSHAKKLFDMLGLGFLSLEWHNNL